MNRIQHKILALSAIVLFIMAVIWTVLMYYNQKTQEQFDDILQRYLRMNEVTERSRQTVTALNNYLLDPSPDKLATLHAAKSSMLESGSELEMLRNSDNGFTLVNYSNMIVSLVEAADLSVMFEQQKNKLESATRFAEASRISKYIAETTLTLIDKDLNTYDKFYRGIIEQSANLKKFGIWMLAFVTLLLLLFTYLFSLSITRPIEKLTVAVRELSRGKFDQRIDVPSNDEISFLARTFDRMRININNLISEIQHKAQLESELKENKLLLQESQLRSLQSQINPHFLFNTLDTLSKKAFMEGAKVTCDLIASVAHLLRYNLKRLDRAVTLREELNVLGQYMEIQQARFTDRLRFDVQVDSSCLDIRLPCLTLQPLIENAVIHAVEPSEAGGTIRFRVAGDAQWVMLEIADDGAGIAPHTIRQIMEESVQVNMQGHSTGIGFSNVMHRLRLYYGVNDVMRISSVPGEGTRVTLRLPRNGGQMQYV